MIQSLLIANRGEIACRIIHTAWAKGFRTVAAYFKTDAETLDARQTDELVHLGLSTALSASVLGRPSFRTSRT